MKNLINKPDAYQITAASGIEYQIEILFYWDDKPDKNIRVIGSISDGGRRIRHNWIGTNFPFNDSFIKDAQNNFVGE